MTIGPETCYRVRGGIPLQGTVFVQGAKNAALKMIAASLLTEKAGPYCATSRPSRTSAGRWSWPRPWARSSSSTRPSGPWWWTPPT